MGRDLIEGALIGGVALLVVTGGLLLAYLFSVWLVGKVVFFWRV